MTDPRSTPPPRLLPGVTLWTLFALFALALRGVRWDENYEFAQAMDPSFGYPETHPLVVYVRNVYNGQFFLSNAAATLTDHAAILNGFRNTLFILATVLPPFLVGAVVGKRPIAGHFCALLVLAGVHLDFDGTYPQFIWPGMFSNGHIGTGFSLGTAALFAGGRLRIASLMLGLMPMIHLGHTPPLLVLAAFFGVTCVAKCEWHCLRSGLPYLAAGLSASAILFAVQRGYAVPPATTGPYAGTESAAEVWRGIVRFHDMHRQIPVGNSHLIPLLLAPLAVAGWRLGRTPAPGWNWTCLYAACVAAIVYGAIAIHMVLGEHTPYAVIGWLPYRLANQLPIILIALCVAVLLHEDEPRGSYLRWLVPALLLFVVLRPLLAGLMSEHTYSRYFADTGSVLFVLVGAACGRVFAARTGDVAVRSVAVSFGVLWLVLLYLHQFGAACTAVGIAVGWTLTRGFPPPVNDRRPFVFSSAAAACLLLVAMLITQFQNRAHLPVGDFERAVAEYLHSQGNPHGILVGPPYQLMLQAQTGHPVMSDMATHYHGSYVPSLAPSIHRMYRAIYGIDLTRPDHDQPGWRRVWSERSADEWRALALEFRFQFVIAPRDLQLDLPIILEGETNSLHRILLGGSCECLP